MRRWVCCLGGAGGGSVLGVFLKMKLFVVLMGLLVVGRAQLLESMDYDHCFLLRMSEPQFHLNWVYNSSHVKISMIGQTQGWLAIGISLDHTMDSSKRGSDIILGYFKNQSPIVNDYWVDDRVKPSLDQRRDITLMGGNEEDGSTSISFIRAWDTGDTAQDIAMDPSSVNVIWGFSSTDPTDMLGILFGKHSHRGYAKINFTQPSSCQLPPEEDRVPILWRNTEDNFAIGWKVYPKEKEIHFRLDAMTLGWIGLGFSDNRNMLFADMTVGWLNYNGESVLLDMVSGENRLLPVLDSSKGGSTDSELLFLRFDDITHTTTLIFKRPFETEDQWDFDLSDMSIYLLWAFGEHPGDSTGYFTKHSHHGILSVNLFDLDPQIQLVPSDNHVVRKQSITIHAAINTIGWLGFMTVGLFFSAFFKKLLVLSFYFHFAVEILGVVCTLAAIAVVVFAVGIVVNVHSLIGLITILLVFMECLFGLSTTVTSDKEFEPNSIKHSIHKYLGWITFICGIANVPIGIFLYRFDSLDEDTFVFFPILLTLFLVWFIFILSVATYLKYKDWKEAQNHGKKLKEMSSLDEKDSKVFIMNPSQDKHLDQDAIELMEDDYVPSSARQLHFEDTKTKKIVLALLVINVLLVIVIAAALLTIPTDSSRRLYKVCPECITMDFTMPHFNIPVGAHHGAVSPTTTYACKRFSLTFNTSGPPPPSTYHIVRMDAVVESSDVYHMILYIASPEETVTGQFIDEEISVYDCLTMPSKSTPIYIWGSGKTDTTQPYQTGIRVNEETEFILQIHYYNPDLSSNHIDSSGVTLELTPILREHDIGFIVFGAVEGIEIPVSQDRYQVTANCSSLAFPHVVHVVSVSFHAHQLGRAVWMEVWRNGQKVETLGDSSLNSYHYSAAAALSLEKPFDLYPGDVVITHCLYDSTSQYNTTSGGYGPEEEMCWAVVAYYPQVELHNCVVHPADNK